LLQYQTPTNPNTKNSTIRKAFTLLFCSLAFFSPFSTDTYSLALAIWNVIRKPRARIASRNIPVFVMIERYILYYQKQNSYFIECLIKPMVGLGMMNDTFLYKRMILSDHRVLVQRPAYH